MQERFKVVYGTRGRAVPALRRGLEHPLHAGRATTTGRHTGVHDVSDEERRIGHKGADLIVPGNTPASFDAALAHGVDMIEFDVLPEHQHEPDKGRLLLAHDYEHVDGAPDARGGPRPPRVAAPFDGVELDVDLKLPGYEAARRSRRCASTASSSAR